jgi:hypothetical protein
MSIGISDPIPTIDQYHDEEFADPLMKQSFWGDFPMWMGKRSDTWSY